MNEIDYGALFDVGDMNETSENQTEAAEPSANAFAQGEKEQGIAEPAVTEQASTAVTEQVEDGKMQNVQEEDGEALQNEQTPGAGEQTLEERARFAAARRKAEAQRDAEIAKAKAQAQRMVDEAFAQSGLTNPYTQKPITTKAEYDEYKARFDAEQKEHLLNKSGLSEAEFGALIQSLPEVKAAKEAKAQAEAVLRQAHQARVKAKLDMQLKEIALLDPSIKSLADLTRAPYYDRFYELVKRGNSLSDAFKLANLDTITHNAAKASKQAAMNALGKQHMAATMARGVGDVSVPLDVREAYLAFNPSATNAEIQRHYNKYLK